MKKDKLQQQSNQTNAGTDAALTYAMMMTKSADLCANLCKDTEKSKHFMEMLERLSMCLNLELISFGFHL